jgi:hypothetical protein
VITADPIHAFVRAGGLHRLAPVVAEDLELEAVPFSADAQEVFR